jgi:hypothetical protein
VQPCTSESSQFPVVRSVKGISPVQVQHVGGEEKLLKGKVIQNVDLDVRQEAELGGGTQKCIL